MSSHLKINHGDTLVFSTKRMEVVSSIKSIPRRTHSSHFLLFIPDHLHRAKAIWDFEGIFCSSRHIPHVRFAGLIHPGILGCAPSAEILAEWNRREGELIAANTIADQIVAQPPNPTNAHGGNAAGDVQSRIAKEGARTIPVSIVAFALAETSVLILFRDDPRTAATAISRTSHVDQRFISLSTSLEPSFPLVTCTSPRAMAKSHSVVESRCPV